MRTRQKLTIAVLATAVVSAVGIVTAGHASASDHPSGVRYVSGTSASSSDTDRSLRLSCPTDYRTISATAVVNGGGGRVTLLNASPGPYGAGNVAIPAGDDPLRWSSFTAREYTSYSANWSLTGYAVCLPKSSIYASVQDQANVLADPNDRNASAKCPSGGQMIGTSYFAGGLLTQFEPGGESVRGTVAKFPNQSATPSVLVRGECAFWNRPLSLRYGYSPRVTNPAATATATCQAGGRVLSAGGKIDTGGGAVAITGVAIAEDKVTVRAEQSPLLSAGGWKLTAYAVCTS